MIETWLINGVPLESVAVMIETDEAITETPELRERTTEVPGMHGLLDPSIGPGGQSRVHGPGRFALGGMVLGVDPVTGEGPAGGAGLQAYYDRAGELIRLLSARVLTIEHVRPDGSVRRAVGSRKGAFRPSRERASPWFGRWQVEVEIPGAFWSATQDVTISATVPSGGAIPLGALGVGDAPITDVLITYGPGNNPTLVQGTTHLAYDGVIGAGRQLVIDTNISDPTVGPGSGATWAPEDSRIRYGPNSSWFEIDPLAGALTLNHTGGGSMSVSITARPRFLTS